MNLKKHKILKALYSEWEMGENRTGYGITVTDIGRSLTTTQLQSKTKIHTPKLEETCNVLVQSNHIKVLKVNKNEKVSRYLILEKGKTDFLEKEFLNRIWIRNPNFWKFALPFLVGLLGLLNSIFHWFTTSG